MLGAPCPSQAVVLWRFFVVVEEVEVEVEVEVVVVVVVPAVYVKKKNLFFLRSSIRRMVAYVFNSSATWAATCRLRWGGGGGGDTGRRVILVFP